MFFIRFVMILSSFYFQVGIFIDDLTYINEVIQIFQDAQVEEISLVKVSLLIAKLIYNSLYQYVHPSLPCSYYKTYSLTLVIMVKKNIYVMVFTQTGQVLVNYQSQQCQNNEQSSKLFIFIITSLIQTLTPSPQRIYCVRFI